MTPARDFTVESHGFPISPEQASILLSGRIGFYFFSHSSPPKAWQLRLRRACQEIAFDALLQLHSEKGIRRLHLSKHSIRARYPTVEIITNSREWWDLGHEFLQNCGRSNGHGERDVGVGFPIHSYTVDYRYFSDIQEGEWDTETKQRIGDPIRYLTRERL